MSTTTLTKTKYSYFDDVQNVEYIDLEPALVQSCKDYNYYIAENELGKMSKRDKNRLGTHFMLNQIINVCKESDTKKIFYYREYIKYPVENMLIKRIFNALPTTIVYDTIPFDAFLIELKYKVVKREDSSAVCFNKFKKFLKHTGLTKVEREFTENAKVKFSLLP